MNLKRLHNDLHEGALQLIAEHRVPLLAKAKSLCGNSSDADELVIRTIDRAIRKIDTYTGEGDILSWMMAILVNLYNHDHRNPVVRNTLPVKADELEKWAGADWATDEQILKNSDSEAIREAISELDPKYNQVLMMRYYEEFTLRQIADILRLPLGTVCRRAQIAHRLLAGKLSAELGKAKRPLAVLLAALLGVGALFGAWVSPLGDWVEEQVFGSVSEAGPTGETPLVQDVLTQTNDISIFVTEKQEGEDNVNIRTNFPKTVATATVAAMVLAAEADSGFDNYERLTYIESTGAQYIDTGVIAGPDVMMSVDFQLTALPANKQSTSRMRCGWAGSDLFVFGCIPDKSDCFMASRCGKNDYHYTDIPVDLNRHTVFLGAGRQSVDGHVSAEESNYVEKSGSLYLFGCHANYAGGMNHMKMKLYGCVIEDGDTVHVYVPCRKKDGTAVGLYDLATDTFLENLGTQGDFVAGEAAEGGLVVVGEPRCLGEVSPVYGYRAVTQGEDVACEASRNASDGVDTYACVGWCVYTNASDSSDWVACEEGTGTSLNLRPFANTTTRLVWRWLRSTEQSPAQESIDNDAYCRVAYVGSASESFKQYVDTKICVAPDVALDVDFRLRKLPSGSTANDRFRCGWAGTKEQFDFGIIPDRTGYGDVFMASMSGTDVNQFRFSGVKVDLLRHRVVIRSGEQKVDASVAADEANFKDPPASEAGTKGTLYLFALHTAYNGIGGVAAYTPMDVYACTITSGDECHELIPCRRRADNVGGFYDTFTGAFLGLGSGSTGSLRVGEDCLTPEAVLKVDGDPLAYGDVIPAYGHVGPLTPGQTLRCSAPLIPGENGEVSCVGYEVYTNRSDDASAWILADSGTENAFDYVHPEGSGAKLVWKWSANGDLAVSHVSVTAQSSSSAGVSVQVESLGVGAKSADVVLEWGTSSNDLDRATVVRSAIAGAQVISTEVSGLPASRVCYARVRVTNDLGDAVRSEIFRIQLLPQGQLLNPSASMSLAADTYTLTASVDLDDACRAAADCVGLWYLFGDPFKAPTENDLQERASIAVAVDQEKISIPIPVGLTDGTGFWQFRAYNVADDGTTNFVTRTLMNKVQIQDSSTYTWTGAGATAAWSDAGNWSGGAEGAYPFSSGASVVFAAGSSGEVVVDRPVSISTMDLSASGLDLVFRSDATPRTVSVDTLTLGLDTTDVRVDSHLVFDAVKLEKGDDANVCIGNGSTIDLVNGAELQLKSGNLRLRYDGGVANGPSGAAFLNVGADCKLTVKNDVEFSGGSVIAISNGTVTVRSTFFNSTSGGGRYRLEGESPSLKVEKTFRGSAIEAVTNCFGGIDFCIPVGGYASAPVIGSGTNEVAVMGGLDSITAKPLVMTVVPESPILKACPKSTDVPLVSWLGTINPNKVTFTKIRKGHGSAFFWGDQSAAPLSFGVRIAPSSGLSIVVR